MIFNTPSIGRTMCTNNIVMMIYRFRCNRIQEWIGTAVAIRATDHDHKQVACRLRGFSGASVNFPPARSD